MKSRYRYGKPTLDRLQTLKEPGRSLAFDADPGLIAELSQQCDIKSLVGGLKAKNRQQREAALRAFGEDLMEATIELADGKYPDRAGEVLERVARQTGISFPHRFQRYVELSIIASRPLDRWNIRKSTTRELVVQVFSCTLQREAQEAGLDGQTLPCQALCLASFGRAAEKTGDTLETHTVKRLPGDDACEFSFVCLKQGSA